MTRLGHLEVKVKIDEAYAQEYDDDDDETEDSESLATKYIEAISSANFAIECTVLPSYVFDADSLSFQIFLDGQRAGGTHIGKKSHNNLNGARSLQTHAPQDKRPQHFLLKYKFANLDTREALPGENAEQMIARYAMLGTISVQVWRKKTGRIINSHDFDNSALKVGGIDVVPEKALKGRALAVSTCLEQDGSSEFQKSFKEATKIDKSPVATFNFKYRTRKALQSLIILPQSPAPTPLEERPVDQLTSEELRELVLRQKAQLRTVKKEDEPKPVVKRERPFSSGAATTRHFKSSRTADGKITYHLDSDEEAEPVGASASRAELGGAAKVEVVDLLD